MQADARIEGLCEAKKRVRIVGDTAICFSTVPGFVSWRNPDKGSWLISSICEVTLFDKIMI